MAEISLKSIGAFDEIEKLINGVKIRQLDLITVRECMEKVGVPTNNVGTGELLRIAHLIRIKLPDATLEEKRASEEFLRFNGLM